MLFRKTISLREQSAQQHGTNQKKVEVINFTETEKDDFWIML